MTNKDYTLINEYLDWYENLLTAKQKEVMNMYYREDFSLAEIAENMGISRSAVSDLTSRVVKTLEGYESKLRIVKKFHERNECYKKLNALNNKEVDKIVNVLYENE